MHWIIASAIMAAASQSAPQPATDDVPRPTEPLLSYEAALRCTGLTQAALQIEGGETAKGRQLHNAALFWSVSTIQASSMRGQTPTDHEAELNTVREKALKALTDADPTAQHNLAECRQRLPFDG